MTKKASQEMETLSELYVYRWRDFMEQTATDRKLILKHATEGRITRLKRWRVSHLVQVAQGTMPAVYKMERCMSEIQINRVVAQLTKRILYKIDEMGPEDLELLLGCTFLSVPLLATVQARKEVLIAKRKARTPARSAPINLSIDFPVAEIQDVTAWMEESPIETVDEQVEEEVDMASEEERAEGKDELQSLLALGEVAQTVLAESEVILMEVDSTKCEPDFKTQGLTVYNFEEHLRWMIFPNSNELKVVRPDQGTDVTVWCDGVQVACRSKGEFLSQFAHRVVSRYYEMRGHQLATELQTARELGDQLALKPVIPPPPLQPIPRSVFVARPKDQAIVPPSSVSLTIAQMITMAPRPPIPVPVLEVKPLQAVLVLDLVAEEDEQTVRKATRAKAEEIRAERLQREMEKRHAKINKFSKKSQKIYNIWVSTLGLRPFPFTMFDVTKEKMKQSVLFFLVSARIKGIIDDVQNVIARFMFRLYEASRNNEVRTAAESHHEGWTKTTKKKENMASMQHVVSEEGLKIARDRTFGVEPVYMFYLTQTGFQRSLGRTVHTIGIYFAVRRPDKGITARVTHSIPAAHRKMNQMLSYEKVVGYNAEPVLARTYPHGLEMADWTVFRIPPCTVKSTQTKHLFWFTVYNADGCLGTRPFAYVKKNSHYEGDFESDIASSYSGRYSILQREMTHIALIKLLQ